MSSTTCMFGSWARQEQSGSIHRATVQDTLMSQGTRAYTHPPKIRVINHEVLMDEYWWMTI